MSVEFFVSRRLNYTQQRRSSRVPVSFAVQMSFEHPEATCRFDDHAVDLSETGIGLQTSRPLPPMSLVTLHLALPSLAEPVRVIGRVMWRSASRMGVRFEQLDARISQVVTSLQRVSASHQS